jgi:hypothetical protein
MASDVEVRKQLLELLRGGHAHTGFDDVLEGFPPERAGVRPKGAPHSAWELLEHMRIAQNDILRFSIEPDYKSPAWPQGYWPTSPAPASQREWAESARAVREDLAAFARLIENGDLYKPFSWGDGQNLMREALVLADHNSYHLGQLMLVRRLVGG